RFQANTYWRRGVFPEGSQIQATCDTMQESEGTTTPAVALVVLCCAVLVAVLLCAKPDRETRHKPASVPQTERPEGPSKALGATLPELDEHTSLPNSAVVLRDDILAADPVNIRAANFEAANHPVAIGAKHNVFQLRSFSALTGNSSANDRTRGISYRPSGVEVFAVIVSYNRSKPDELDLALGERILLRKAFRDGWCEGIRMRPGENIGEIGMFPLYCIAGDPRLGIGSKWLSVESPQESNLRDSLKRGNPGYVFLQNLLLFFLILKRDPFHNLVSYYI
ncbi:hypothetical protein HK096_005789, partial [Nowakowskiella sp. JEL0078]